MLATLPVDLPAQKEAVLLKNLKSLPSLLVAYSGGVDSSYLMHTAHVALGSEAIGLIADSPSLAREELEAARQLANTKGWKIVEVKTQELEEENYASNPANRCFFCKHEMFTRMSEYAAGHGISAIAYGENIDDLRDHRPSRPAAVQFDLLAPLQDANLSKAEIRELSRRAGLPTAAKAAQPCLASRLPTGQRVTRSALAQIEAGEALMRQAGMRIVRLRHLGNTAHLEAGPDDWTLFVLPEIRAKLARDLQQLGFADVTFADTPYRGPSLR